MLREEQIDIRRQRGRLSQFAIENLGKNRVFSEYRVTNPESGGQYTVVIRSYDTGDNTCTCPDFRSNTLGTCKHIEAVLDRAQADGEPVRRRRAAVTRPEVDLDYSAPQLRLRLFLPPRHSEKLRELSEKYFDASGLWNGKQTEMDLIHAIHLVPEPVTVTQNAMEFVARESERRELLAREAELLAELDSKGDAATIRRLLKAPLYDYQARGAIFLACRGRAILGDDMGLGKSVQTLAAIELLARERGISKVLVVAPASVKFEWEKQVRQFTDRTVSCVEGLKDVRETLYQQADFFKLVNYEQVVRDLAELNAWAPDVVVLDEAQRIKNWESKTSRAVKKLRSRFAMVLSGTPLENRLEELYSVVQFVDDRRLGPAFEFLHEHRQVDEQGRLIGYQKLDRVRERLAPVLLRRTRAEVLTQLPPRTDSIRFVELAPEQQHMYDEQRANLGRLLSKPVLSDLDRKRVLACITNMRLICDSTFLFDKQTNVSPKIDELSELIQDLLSSGDHKAIIFSQWETMLHKVADLLHDLGVSFSMLHGGMSGPERRQSLKRFEDADCRVFLTTDAGGVGLNLQVADTVINMELPWNPAVLEQRIARAHRLGQDRPVRVVHFATRGTIEERVLKALEAKSNLFGAVFDGESDEISFNALADNGLMESIRDVAGDDVPPAVPSNRSAQEAHVRMLEAMAQFDAVGPLPAPLADRARLAIEAICQSLSVPFTK